MVQFHPGSFWLRRFVGALVARVLGKDEARFRSRTDIKINGPACRWGRLTLARSVRWVRLPSGPLKQQFACHWCLRYPTSSTHSFE